MCKNLKNKRKLSFYSATSNISVKLKKACFSFLDNVRKSHMFEVSLWLIHKDASVKYIYFFVSLHFSVPL